MQHLGIFFHSLQLTSAKHVGELYGTRIKITKKTTGSAVPGKSKYNRDNLKFLDSCLQERRQFVMQITFTSVFGENVISVNSVASGHDVL